VKKFLLTTIIAFGIGILIPTSIYALTCGEDGTKYICGSSGGCPDRSTCVSNGNSWYCDEPTNYPCWNVIPTDNILPSPTGAPSPTASITPNQTIQLQKDCEHRGGTWTGTRCLLSNSVITPTPTTEVLTVNGTVCPNDGTVYPPNSTCYAEVKARNTEMMGINLVDSSGSILTYPLSCTPGPNITYKEIYTSSDDSLGGTKVDRDVIVTTDFTNAELGFLGPDSTSLATKSPDTLAQNYLFNALFDRPGADPNISREAFRTYWRMLSSLSQVQLKAYYFGVSNPDNIFYYVGQDKTQKKVRIGDLKDKLKNENAHCLYQYTDFDHLTDTLGIDFWNNCWKKGNYTKQYQNLSPSTKEQYEALLPFDFNNMRAYLSDGTTISQENIPYLRAILTGLKGYRSDILTPMLIPGIGQVSIPYTIIPGLFDYYTPGWAGRPLALYPTFGVGFADSREALQQEIIKLIAALTKSCAASANAPSQPSPKTYPNPNTLDDQKLTVHATYNLVRTDPGSCFCPPDDIDCNEEGRCSGYTGDNCPGSCNSTPSISTYEIKGQAVGKPITVFNNPFITSLTDLIMGGKKLINTASNSQFTQSIIDSINAISDRLINPVQPSFYKMLLPDFASNSASPKTMVGAPNVNNSATPVVAGARVTVQGDHTIYRENNLAQDTMHLLQNCWLVPANQQKSPKCPQAQEVCEGGGTVPEFKIDLSCAMKNNTLGLPDKLVEAIEAAASAYQVPASLLVGVFYGEGAFNPGSKFLDPVFVESQLNSCTLLPNCDPNADVINNIAPFFKVYWGEIKNAVKIIAPDRTPNACNLLDGIFAAAKDISRNQYGSAAFAGKTCYGIPLNPGTGTSSTCDWDQSDVETAIRVWEFGFVYNDKFTCATLENSCFTGGGPAMNCVGGDICETISSRYSNASHNACVMDVYLSN